MFIATKGTLWTWLTLLAIRGLVVFCFYLQHKPVNASAQQEDISKESYMTTPPVHHYRINQVHTASISFFVLS